MGLFEIREPPPEVLDVKSTDRVEDKVALKLI